MFTTELNLLKHNIRIGFTLYFHSIKRCFCKKMNSLYKLQFLNGDSATYVEEMYRVWQQEPNSVHATDSYTPPPGITSFASIQETILKQKEGSLQKPIEPVVQKPIEPVVQKPIEPVVQKPIEPVIQKPIELVVQKPIEAAVQKPIEPVVQKPIEPVIQKPIELVVQKPIEAAVQKPIEDVVQKPIESVIQKPIEPAVQKPIEHVVQKPIEPAVQKPIEPVKQKPVEPFKQKPIEPEIQKPLEIVPPKVDIVEKPNIDIIPLTEPSKKVTDSKPLILREVDYRYLNMDKISDDEEDTQIYLMMQSYQHYGCFMSKIDPLGLQNYHAKLGRMEKKIKLPFLTWIADDIPDRTLPLGEIINRYEKVYCKNIGHQGAYTNQLAIKQWLVRQLENTSEKVTKLEKQIALKRLIRSTAFEDFMRKQWPGDNHLSLQGCETILPALSQIIDTSSVFGVDRVTIGMGFRGRLNVLANSVKIPMPEIFTAYQGTAANQISSSDIKCQLGTTNELLNLTSHKNIRISMTANPAHLGAVGAVVCGKVRAQMFYSNDLEGKRFLPIVIHGDSEISGLGLCFETINLCKLPAHTTHGTIHLIINNQMNGTALSHSLRSSIFCTSIGRIIDAPIIHVNGTDVTSVIYAAKLAAEYRARFNGDVFLDIMGYRQLGHSSENDSMFTEPIMYTKVAEMRSVLEEFYNECLSEKIITEGEYQTFEQEYEKLLKVAFEQSKSDSVIKPKNWLESSWQGFFEGKDLLYCAPTGISEDTILHIGSAYSSPPPSRNFVILPNLKRILSKRQKMLEERTIDWAMGEAIAFGSLLKDGIHVRLIGQDAERSAFSFRHHVIHHQTSKTATYNPLCNLYPDQAAYIIGNSSLSEAAVLAFELGYSLISPNQLVIWEAQFGDFLNTAQVIVDQYIASGERKWIRQSGLVLLLPHGLEGLGSEHSNGHPERFLMLSNDDPESTPDVNDELCSLKQLLLCNIILANLTTPANYFHILRRQILLPFRKPLVILTPKLLLRLPAARSSIDDISGKTEFHRIFPETGPASDSPLKVKKLIFCSGKVYYDLVDIREKKNLLEQIAITRVEQLAPFPYDKVQKELKKYNKVSIIAWVQEEHRNTGPWYYVEPRFNFLGVHDLKYIGRLASSVPATGYRITHEKQKLKLLEEAMEI